MATTYLQAVQALATRLKTTADGMHVADALHARARELRRAVPRAHTSAELADLRARGATESQLAHDRAERHREVIALIDVLAERLVIAEAAGAATDATAPLVAPKAQAVIERAAEFLALEP